MAFRKFLPMVSGVQHPLAPLPTKAESMARQAVKFCQRGARRGHTGSAALNSLNLQKAPCSVHFFEHEKILFSFHASISLKAISFRLEMKY